MTGVAEYHIPWLDIKVQRLFTLVQERDELSLRQVQYMAMRLSAETLQNRCRRLEMVTDARSTGKPTDCTAGQRAARHVV
jgi:hypothetical protein